MQGMSHIPVHHRASVGIGAAIIGVGLGIGLVYWDGSNDRPKVLAQAVNADCTGDPGYKYPERNPNTGQQGLIDKPCKEPDGVGGMCDGLCKVTGQCVGVSCNGKKLEGKPKEEPKGSEMPKLPEIPKGGGGGEPKPPADPCTKNPTSTECKSTQTPSGVSGFLSNIFGTNANTNTSSTGGQSTLQNAISKLQSFLGGENTGSQTDSSSNAVNNPTEAAVTPVTPSASQAGQVTSQTGSSQQGSSNTSGTQGIGSTVTGFGSDAQADASTQTGPIVAGMKSVLTRIQSILSSLF